MKKKNNRRKKKNNSKIIYRLFSIVTIVLVISIVYSRAMLSEINLTNQKLTKELKNEKDYNQTLIMKINEKLELDNVNTVSTQLGLKFDNKNLKSIAE